jgi:glutathione S-transferase
MLTVHGAPASPFVRKVLVALEEKEIPYELNPVFPFGPNPEFRKISPLGKIPAITEDGRALCDSSVICAYLERRQPQPALYPSDPYEYGRALWFEEYADTAMVNVIGAKIFFPRVVGPRFMNQPTDEAAVAKAVSEDLPPLFDYLESQLTGTDLAVTSQLINLSYAGVVVDGGRWSRLRGLYDATVARPSLQRRLEQDRALLGG